MEPNGAQKFKRKKIFSGFKNHTILSSTIILAEKEQKTVNIDHEVVQASSAQHFRQEFKNCSTSAFKNSVFRKDHNGNLTRIYYVPGLFFYQKSIDDFAQIPKDEISSFQGIIYQVDSVGLYHQCHQKNKPLPPKGIQKTPQHKKKKKRLAPRNGAQKSSKIQEEEKFFRV